MVFSIFCMASCYTAQAKNSKAARRESLSTLVNVAKSTDRTKTTSGPMFL